MGSGASKRVGQQGKQQGGLSPKTRRMKQADDAAKADFYAHRFERQGQRREQAKGGTIGGKRDKVVSERAPEGLATYVPHDLEEGLAAVDLLEKRAAAATAAESVDLAPALASGLATIRRVLLDVRAKDMSFRVDNDALDDETSRWLAEKTGVSAVGQKGETMFEVGHSAGFALTEYVCTTHPIRSSSSITGAARVTSIAI